MMIKLKSAFIALSIMAVGVVFSGSAFADPICETLDECRSLQIYLRKQSVEHESQIVRDFLLFQLAPVDARIEELLACQPGDETRTTTTGAVFTCDRSNLALGEAWRDPDGLIWGDLVKRWEKMGKGSDGIDRTSHKMEYKEAIDYCGSIGARLPSTDEVTRLREYMGAQPGTHKGYSPQVLPNLKNYFWLFWVNPDPDSSATFFNGWTGDLYTTSLKTFSFFRCVMSH